MDSLNSTQIPSSFSQGRDKMAYGSLIKLLDSEFQSPYRDSSLKFKSAVPHPSPVPLCSLICIVLSLPGFCECPVETVTPGNPH